MLPLDCLQRRLLDRSEVAEDLARDDGVELVFELAMIDILVPLGFRLVPPVSNEDSIAG